jgi:hypothetical protein
MKKVALLVLLMLSLVTAEVSQDTASNTCTKYSLDGESISVRGPVSCEGEYWLCDFVYYGNKQNMALLVSRSDGSVVSPSSDIFEDLTAVKYAMDNGNAYLFDTFLTDPSFAIELNGMNATIQNYEGVMKSLERDDYITQVTYIDFKNRLEMIRMLALDLAVKSEELYNMSSEFLDSPDCVELIDYSEEMDESLSMAENFSKSWGDFISRYNSLVESIEEVYVAAINPSDAEIMKQSIDSIRVSFDEYQNDASDYFQTVKENVESRGERREAKEELDTAYNAVNGKSQEAVNKYSEASVAFSNGDYVETKRLAREAVILAEQYTGNDDPVVIVEESPDYSIFFIAIGVLLVLVIIVTLMKRNNEEDEDVEPKKGKIKSSWSFTSKKKSSMERASESSLDSD